MTMIAGSPTNKVIPIQTLVTLKTNYPWKLQLQLLSGEFSLYIYIYIIDKKGFIARIKCTVIPFKIGLEYSLNCACRPLDLPEFLTC